MLGGGGGVVSSASMCKPTTKRFDLKEEEEGSAGLELDDENFELDEVSSGDEDYDEEEEEGVGATSDEDHDDENHRQEASETVAATYDHEEVDSQKSKCQQPLSQLNLDGQSDLMQVARAKGVKAKPIKSQAQSQPQQHHTAFSQMSMQHSYHQTPVDFYHCY